MIRRSDYLRSLAEQDEARAAQAICTGDFDEVERALRRAQKPRRVIEGGSHLCAPSNCFRYWPVARQPQDIDTGMSHIEFRCVVRSHG